VPLGTVTNRRLDAPRARHQAKRAAVGATRHADGRRQRISYGCINVPVAFYEAYVRPTVATCRTIVYVLPEIKPVRQVFNSYDVATVRRQASNRATGDALSTR